MIISEIYDTIDKKSKIRKDLLMGKKKNTWLSPKKQEELDQKLKKENKMRIIKIVAIAVVRCLSPPRVKKG